MSSIALIIFCSAFFFFWSAYLVLERLFGMSPEIYATADLKEKDQLISEKRGESTVIYQSSTKSMDGRGVYRIRIRPQIHYLKGIAMLVLTGVSIWPVVAEGSVELYERMFIEMDPTSISTIYVQTAAAILLAWYFFEMVILMQYYKLDWPNILHHWLTSFAAILVLLEVYIPAAILYGIFIVALAFPVFLLMGYRAHKGNEKPGITRKAHKWAAYYFAFLLFTCIVLQLALLWNGVSKGIHGYGYVGIILLCCVAWCYDDMQLIKALRKASKRPYELLQFDSSESKS